MDIFREFSFGAKPMKNFTAGTNEFYSISEKHQKMMHHDEKNIDIWIR